MRYTKPAFEIELIKTNDVICDSPYTVAHQKVMNKETGEEEMHTIVTVEAGNLF